jgi:EmrB/QacA subfamily drug resistance transporter
MVLFLACACQFLVILDVSIVNVALPSIQRDLGFTDTGLAWVVNGYLLTFAGLMLLGGRAADVFGQRRMLVAGLAVFALSSLVGGLAAAPEILVAARFAQGVGGAMPAPATLSVINTGFPGERARARAFGAWSAAGGVGGMAGALAGGVITTGLSWRWVFLINVPIGAVLIVLAVMSLAVSTRRVDSGTSGSAMSSAGTRTGRREPLDLVGAITGTTGLAALIYGVTQSAAHGWASVPVAGPMVTGVLLLIVFTVVEARFAARPMLPLRLFRIRRVAVGNGMLLLFGGIAIAMWYFTSLFLQNVLGYSALAAGLGQTPAAVTFVVVARLAATLLPRTGVRALVLGGCCGFLTGFGWLAQAGPGSGYVTGLLGPTLLVAVGIGLTFPTLMAAATADVSDGDAGVLGGLAGTASQVGGSVGLAVLATVAGAGTASAAAAGTPAALAAGYELVFLVAAAGWPSRWPACCCPGTVAVDGQTPLEPEAGDDEVDHLACVVAGGLGADAEVADAAHQGDRLQVRDDLAGRLRRAQQLGADRHQAVQEIGVQRLEGRLVGLHRLGQAVLGDQEVDEQVDPARERGVRSGALRQQRRAGRGARFDLMPVDRHDQVGPGGEVAVDRADADAGPGGDRADRRIDPGRDEHRGGRVEQRLLVAPGVRPLLPRWAGSAVRAGHRYPRHTSW